jgi:hypothetical protein
LLTLPNVGYIIVGMEDIAMTTKQALQEHMIAQNKRIAKLRGIAARLMGSARTPRKAAASRANGSKPVREGSAPRGRPTGYAIEAWSDGHQAWIPADEAGTGIASEHVTARTRAEAEDTIRIIRGVWKTDGDEETRLRIVPAK